MNMTDGMWVARAIICILIGITGLSGTTFANEPDPMFTPNHFGVYLGMAEPELLGSLASQGFSFEPGGKNAHITGSNILTVLFDFVLSIGPENGSVEIWKSGNVLLGIQDGKLAVIEEFNELESGEADQVFRELVLEFDAYLEATAGSEVSRRRWTKRENDFRDEWAALQWLTPRGELPPDSDSAQKAWRAGTRLVILSIRHALDKFGRADKEKKVILLLHADWCAYPVLERIWSGNRFDCSARSAGDRVTAARAPEDLPSGQLWLDVSLDASGQVLDAQVVGDVEPAVGESAMNWVRGLNFEPAMINDRAVPSTTSVIADYISQLKDSQIVQKFFNYRSGPRPLKITSPAYPRIQRQAGKAGWVEVSFTINASGQTSDIAVVESSEAVFEKSALDAVAEWTFRPRTANGLPIPSTAIQVIEYNPVDNP